MSGRRSGPAEDEHAVIVGDLDAESLARLTLIGWSVSGP